MAMAEPLRSCLPAHPVCAHRRLVGRRRAASSLTQLPALAVASPQCTGSTSSHGRAASFSLPLLLIPWRKMNELKRTHAIRKREKKSVVHIREKEKKSAHGLGSR